MLMPIPPDATLNIECSHISPTQCNRAKTFLKINHQLKQSTSVPYHHDSSLNSHSPPSLIASLHLSSTFFLSNRLASSLSCSNSCVVGISVRQKPGGVVCLSC